MRITTTLAAVSLFMGGVATADDHSAGLGMFAVAPDFNLGGSLAFYNVVSAFGADGSVYGGNEKLDDGRTRHAIGASLGINVELLDDLYPSVGATISGAQKKGLAFHRQEKKCPVHHGVPHCPLIAETEIEHEDPRWGVEVKATYVLFDGWLGVTAGYRLTFSDPLGHQAMLGASVLIQAPAPIDG